ncbi:MAG TPA: hypothetical protein VG389_27265 [Myxococcota bacterium]|jgi:hypothetical protein|nr:hypothetical protein [Myxococcota bacterium]
MNVRGRILGVLLGTVAVLVLGAAPGCIVPEPVPVASVGVSAGVGGPYADYYHVFYSGTTYYWVDGAWLYWDPMLSVWASYPAYSAPVYLRHYEATAKAYRVPAYSAKVYRAPGAYSAKRAAPAPSPSMKGKVYTPRTYGAVKVAPRAKPGKGGKG